MKIAITGANGQLGRLIIQGLLQRVAATDIAALVRTPAKATDLGVEVREADYNRPETLDQALHGIDTLMFISGSEVGQRLQQHENIIHAAKKANIKRVIYTSLLHADRSTLSLAAEHVATEALLKAADFDLTLLRNGWYTENYTASVASALAHGALIGSAGHGQIASAARADYADAAVKVLSSDGHTGKTYELAGDTAYTLSELAAEISEQTGREIPYQDLSATDFANALSQAGLVAPWPQALASFDVEAAKGALFDDTQTLSKLIGRQTTSLKASVAAALNQI